jgi:hypothetical protein
MAHSILTGKDVPGPARSPRPPEQVTPDLAAALTTAIENIEASLEAALARKPVGYDVVVTQRDGEDRISRLTITPRVESR